MKETLKIYNMVDRKLQHSKKKKYFKTKALKFKSKINKITTQALQLNHWKKSAIHPNKIQLRFSLLVIPYYAKISKTKQRGKSK